MIRECVAAVCLLSITGAVSAATLPVLVPAPQEIAWNSDAPEWLPADALTGIAPDPTLPPDMAAAALVSGALRTPLAPAATGNMHLVIASLPETLPARTRHEAYRLVVDNTGVRITAETAHGIHNGLVTLAQLADAEKGLPCVSITDWPEQEMRGTYVPGIAQAEKRFDQFVSLKLNLLLLEDGALYDLDTPETCARFQRLADRCRAHFIEFVPELQSLGWGHFVLQREPRAVEARRVERAPFPVRDGKVYSPDPSLPEAPALINPSFDAGLEGWTAETHYQRWHPSSPDEAKIAPLPGGTGGNALQLSLTEQGTVRVAQEVPVTPNACYEFRCRIRGDNIAGDGGAYIEVYGIADDGSMTLIGHNSRRIQGTADWQDSAVVIETGAHQRARPGGALEAESEAAAQSGYGRVRVYLRLQDATGTAWFDGVTATPLPSPNPLANVVVTERATVVVESADGATVYEENRDYTLIVPELRYPFRFGEALAVNITPGSRIKEGDTLLLSFNQARHEDITCCPSEPLYDAFMKRAIANVVEKLTPNFLHIGHDEPRFFNRDQRCAERNLTNEALFADAITRIHASAKAANPNIRVMIWDDALNPYQNGPHLKTSDAARLLPRDIIVNVWWYDNFDLETQLDKSVDYFMSLGFSVTGSPWFRIPNAQHWAGLFHRHRENEKALGIIYTSWDEVPDPWAALEFTAEHSWSFGKPALAE